MDILESDWKLLRQKLPKWQEDYMSKLLKEYIELLSNNFVEASERFWEIKKRIDCDCKNPGVVVEMRRSRAVTNIASLISYGVITENDISDFSEELKQQVNLLVKV